MLTFVYILQYRHVFIENVGKQTVAQQNGTVSFLNSRTKIHLNLRRTHLLPKKE